jgi:hypothetical protein
VQVEATKKGMVKSACNDIGLGSGDLGVMPTRLPPKGEWTVNKCAIRHWYDPFGGRQFPAFQHKK